jgi:hypothetical protein
MIDNEWKELGEGGPPYRAAEVQLSYPGMATRFPRARARAELS